MQPEHRSLTILFADDEPSLQNLMRIELPRRGHTVTVCPDGLTAVAALERNTYDCVLVDLDMPGLNGIEVIGKAKELMPDAEAIVLTGKSSLQSAIEALRHGAFDYLTKPCKMAELDALLGRIAEKRELTNRCRVLQRQLDRVEGGTNIVGVSPAVESVRQRVQKVAPTSATILIRGETGTGKELVAKSAHESSPRSGMPFVAVNCGALPESLIESELFGHCKGAFTGADQARSGLFEMAMSGTLFLDEIGELPRNMQAKLLRVLESGEVRRVGDNKSIHVDVRIVCATHRDLEQMVADGEFREDLLFRINTFEIQVPPLRNRLEDIPLLAHHLLSRLLQAPARPEDCFSPDALEQLCSYSWPGNVRELANAIEHATILCDDLPILPEHLPHRCSGVQASPAQIAKLGPITLRDLEQLAITAAMDRNQGHRGKAAEELGINSKTLYNKLNTADPPEAKAA